MTLSLMMLLFLVAIAGAIVGIFAGAIYVWLMSRDRHDPHAFAFNDHPFFASAGVARPDAGDRLCAPQSPRSPAALSERRAA